MDTFFLMPGCRVDAVQRFMPDQLHTAAHGRERQARCPGCGQLSASVHRRYRRRPADLPSLGCQVHLGLLVRRFCCRHSACARTTFAERLPGLLAPRARRTRRLAAAQSAVAVALGGHAGARLLERLDMPASVDILLRLLRRAPLPAVSRLRALGVDDWAIRKRQSYGTILVDRDAHRVVDLLPDRSAATLAAWLGRRKTVPVIARDRSTEYARGIRCAAPRAAQVADRWHLLLNARQMAERWLTSAYGRLRCLPMLTDRP